MLYWLSKMHCGVKTTIGEIIGFFVIVYLLFYYGSINHSKIDLKWPPNGVYNGAKWICQSGNEQIWSFWTSKWTKLGGSNSPSLAHMPFLFKELYGPYLALGDGYNLYCISTVIPDTVIPADRKCIVT